MEKPSPPEIAPNSDKIECNSSSGIYSVQPTNLDEIEAIRSSVGGLLVATSDRVCRAAFNAKALSPDLQASEIAPFTIDRPLIRHHHDLWDVSSDGRHVAIAEDHHLHLFDLNRPSDGDTLIYPDLNEAMAIRLSNDSMLAIGLPGTDETGLFDPVAYRIVNIEAGKIRFGAKGHELNQSIEIGWIAPMHAFGILDPNENQLWCFGRKMKPTPFDVPLDYLSTEIVGAAIDPKGKQVAIAYCDMEADEMRLILGDVDQNAIRWAAPIEPGKTFSGRVTWHPEQPLLMLANTFRTRSVLSIVTTTGEALDNEERTLEVSTEIVDYCWLADGRTIAVATEDTLIAWIPELPESQHR